MIQMFSSWKECKPHDDCVFTVSIAKMPECSRRGFDEDGFANYSCKEFPCPFYKAINFLHKEGDLAM